jgi:hypothetical protein
MPRKPTIQITSLDPPINGGTIYHGMAESADGQRYMWHASPGHRTRSCFREDPSGFWMRDKAPPALVSAVRAALRAAAH